MSVSCLLVVLIFFLLFEEMDIMYSVTRFLLFPLCVGWRSGGCFWWFEWSPFSVVVEFDCTGFMTDL